MFRLNYDNPPNDQEVLIVEDWAGIRRMRRGEGMPISVVARQLGIARKLNSSASLRRPDFRARHVDL
jgi:hypothetical protein